MEAIEKEVERVAAKVPTLYPIASSSSSSTSHPSSSKQRSSKAKASASSTTPSSTATVAESLDGLLASLESIRSSLANPASSPPSAPVVVAETKAAVAASQRAIADRQKEVYNALARLGKAYDKKFTTPIDELASPDLFTSVEATRATEAVIMDQLMRSGQWKAAEELSRECGLPLPPSHVYLQLANITSSIRAGNLDAAIQWAESNRNFLTSRSSNLEFALHRSQFLRIATGAGVTPFSTIHIRKAVEYGRIHFRRHLGTHLATIQALFSFSLFLPPLQPNRLPTISELYEQVPFTYHHFLDAQQMHSPHLEPLFAIEYCARNAMSREAPLKIAVEVGVSGGALLKIHKARKVMKVRRNEWSQANELPIDIPLPSSFRFHSTFTCPVSKEQATEENPPMMMSCGHVVCAESLARLGKGHGRVKCPYCPMESTISQATRLYF
ncbi:hypothetical protein BCV69DRAFT_252960 [Microstroma glucosiphilum]|uniref:GID complex catalytic subunit 2 n=1 Tax=Pseudomicrostroma glucosiphilum TaxID=1684307 RepID=A0A316U050_9BASI|nr:hypothetical protein BCV69DRAFT_252960 [Pseudomicrostroma glucosiphilum]PWN18274.1 hypothetical protein BCV69DRAFT_252960 [Pseudomicrostroma glucosiphilum]